MGLSTTALVHLMNLEQREGRRVRSLRALMGQDAVIEWLLGQATPPSGGKCSAICSTRLTEEWEAERAPNRRGRVRSLPSRILGRARRALPGRRSALPPLGRRCSAAQLDDGGWNCHMRNRPSTRHSSFHTTFNVLENLRIAADRDIVPELSSARPKVRAVEFMLAHRLYRSDRTGQVISERFTHLTYPWHWHYTVLRGLDYLRLTPAISDERLGDAIDMLRESAESTDGGRCRSASRNAPRRDGKARRRTAGGTRLRALRVLRLGATANDLR